MAQLPPKIPTMTTTTPNWPDFSSQKLPSIAATAAATTTAGPQQQNPSWMDEFLDFSATRRGTHRRSISDSIAFLEAPSSGVGNHHFDRFDDEQFMSMFNDDIHNNHHHHSHNNLNGNVGPTRSSSNTSTPSDHNSISDDDNNNNNNNNKPPPSDLDHPSNSEHISKCEEQCKFDGNSKNNHGQKHKQQTSAQRNGESVHSQCLVIKLLNA